MFRRSLAAVVVVCVVGSIVAAGTIDCVVTKVTDKEITVKTKKDKKDKEYTEEKTIKVNKDTKFFTKKGKGEATESSLGDVTTAVEKAVKNEKNPLKGARATIETDDKDDTVAAKVTVNQRGKKN